MVADYAESPGAAILEYHRLFAIEGPFPTPR